MDIILVHIYFKLSTITLQNKTVYNTRVRKRNKHCQPDRII